MAVQWDDSLKTGNITVDNQHKEFINRINKLVDAMRAGKGKDEVSSTVDFLGDYVRLHFSAEEKLMSDSTYPDVTSHKNEHKGFVQDFEAFKSELENEELGATRAHAIKAQNWLSSWLFSHIKKTDKQFIKTIQS
jgi:hemerythrin-like metal-binding protein